MGAARGARAKGRKPPTDKRGSGGSGRAFDPPARAPIPRANTPEVVWVRLHDRRCSAVIIGPDLILTTAHAPIAKRNRIGVQGAEIGHVVEPVSTLNYPNLKLDLRIWRVSLLPSNHWQCVRPQVVTAKKGDEVRVVGFGKPDPIEKREGFGEVSKVAVPGSTSPYWVVNMKEPAVVCDQDSGGGAYIRLGETFQLAGIILGPDDSDSECSDRERIAAFRDDVVAWIEQVTHEHNLALCPAADE